MKKANTNTTRTSTFSKVALLATALLLGTIAANASAQTGGWGTNNSIGPTNSFGEKIAFRNGELFYTARITQREAERVVKFLDDMYGHLENFKSYQLDKDGEEMVLRSVVNDSALNSSELDESFRAVEFLLQTQVFTGTPVRLELTDAGFRTRKTFNDFGVRPFGKRIAFNQSELYFTKDVTRQQANDLAKYLMEISKGENREISFQLDRDGATVVVRMVANDTAINTTELDASFEALELDFQNLVFKGSDVRFELTDYKFEPQKFVDKHPLAGGVIG